jgi:hypothetical protein
MSATKCSAKLPGVARLSFAPVSALTQESSLRRLRGITRLAIVVGSALALSGVVERASAQSTYSCSSATPSTNCAMSIAGGTDASSTTTTPAGLTSSTLTVSGATGPVASVKVVLQGVQSSTAVIGGGGNSADNQYSSLCYVAFVLEDPNGDKLALLGATGNEACTDAMSGVGITIQAGGAAAPPSPGTSGAWPSTGTATVAPSSYWNTFSITPLYDSSSNDLPQTDGTATLSKFSGAAANGTWTLHLADSDQVADYPKYITDPVSISGWQLILTYSNLPSTTTTVSSSVNPSYTASPNNTTTLTATVTTGGSGISGGTVSFTSNNSPISCSGGNQTVSGGTATCDTSFSAEGEYPIQAAYSGSSSYAPSNSSALNQLVINHTTNPSGNTYCNPGNLSTTGNTATDTVYPSYVQVPNTVTESVGNVSVQLNDLQSTNGTSGAVSSTAFLLASPGETNNLDFLSHVETGNPQPAVNVTIADGNPLVPNGEGENGGICNGGSGPNCDLQTGTYGPTDDHLSADSFVTQAASPAPPSPNYPEPYGGGTSETLEQAFSGATAAGNWLLYVENDSGSIPLSMSGGWCIDLTLNTGAPTATVVATNNDPATTGQSVQITATVTSGGNPVTTGTVSFTDSVAGVLGSPMTLNGAGTATYSSSAFTEGDHHITATYNGSASFNTSFGTKWLRVNDATAVTRVNATTWQYCNTGPVLGQSIGAYTPNPSNIFVTNFPGTLNSVAVDLNDFSIYEETPPYLAALIEGPSGAALDFFSNTGGLGVEQADAGNYVFEDSASGLVPENESNISPGTYVPTSYQPSYASADTFISSLSGFYPAPSTFNIAPTKGSFVFGNTFPSGINPDGTWSLFFNQHIAATEPSGATQGWCVQLAENPPAVAVSIPTTDTFVRSQQGSFIVNIENNGPGSTGDPTGGSHPMTLTDVLNSDFTYASFTGTGWSCGASGQTVTCTNGSTVAAGNDYPSLTLTLNVSGTASGTTSNSVSVSGAGAASTNSNTDTITIDIPPAINSASSTTFAPGANGTFTVTATGTPTPSLSDGGATLPSAVTFVDNGNGTATLSGIPAAGTGGTYPITITASNGATPNATQSFTLTVSPSAMTINWTPVGTIIAGDAGTAVLNASASCGACGTFSYTESQGGPAVGIASTTALAAGTYTITANFNPTNPAAWSANSAQSTLVVSGESVWIVNSGAGGTSELAGNGFGITSSAYGGANLAVAIDNAGNVWSVGAGPLLEETNQVGAVKQTINSGGGLNTPAGVAIDGNGQVWVTDGNNAVSLFSNAGAPISPSGGIADPSVLSTPSGVAVDVAGSVWIANKGSNSVTRILGGAAPAAPLATAAATNTTGAKP